MWLSDHGCPPTPHHRTAESLAWQLSDFQGLNTLLRERGISATVCSLPAPPPACRPEFS